MSSTILDALAAQLGEETVLAMAFAYIRSVRQRITERLERQTRSATTGTLNDLGAVIHEAAEAGLTNTEAYIDALSRFDALIALLEGPPQ